MIISFKVGNYKSIKDPVVLNFNASGLSEHRDSNIHVQGNKTILKSVLLYGHNASGKSKILDALSFFQWYTVNSATEKIDNTKQLLEPFRLSKQTKNKPSLFELTFIIGNVTYRYGFELDDKKVHKEWLLEVASNERPLFLRINQEFQINHKNFENAEGLEKRTRKNALFLSVSAQWNVLKAQKIEQYIDKIYNVHGIDDKAYRDVTIDLLKNRKYVDLIQKFIKKADLGINSIDVLDIPISFDDIKEKVPEELRERFKETFEKRKPVTIISTHNVFDEDKIIDVEPFIFNQAESEGTKKYFSLVGLLILALNENRPIIIDEFDARLHSLLSKSIIKLFNSSKIKTKSQLIVATHDTSLIDREVLRRDQVYFVEKDVHGATKLSTLAEYKPRKETPYDKNYLDGKYGGIPFIGDLENIFSDEQETK